MAAASLATLRSKIEFDLRGRVPAPFTYRDRNVFEPEADRAEERVAHGRLAAWRSDRGLRRARFG